MSTYDHSAQELEHIRAMIAFLDHVLQDNHNRQVTPVMSPDYWRTRIEALLAERLSPTLEQQAHTLLERLGALGTQRGRGRHVTQHPQGFAELGIRGSQIPAT
ncbi:hypothetical protein [Paraburkholderia susongensis]|uniref:Uncharacterized protein n=1 Tax=Paraburkholderia susongensis TaxID=1515439 RepID=A0A1X7LHH5_9BURK|nr:hypothetical protein [Paraburkholderia susongensis]SMG52639.1 hypothetical protein SAMN06265784_1065 [Paraburkholderia susongensis]